MNFTGALPDSSAYPAAVAGCLTIAQVVATLTAQKMNEFVVTDADPFAEVDVDRQGHAGSKAIRVDSYLGAFVNDIVNRRELQELALGPITIFQEERRAAYSSRDDTARVRLIADPLDGSSIMGAFGIAGVSVLVYSNMNHQREWRLVAGAISLNSGYLFSYRIHRKTVKKSAIDASVFAHRFNPHGDDLTDNSVTPALYEFDLEDRRLLKKPGVALFSASASPTRRERNERYLGPLLPEIRFQGTFAGNLSVWGALLGTCEVVSDPEDATLHDANYLVFLSATDWLIYDLDTLLPLDLESLFNVEPEAGITEQKRVPPVIAVRDARQISRLLEVSLDNRTA